MTELKPCPFCGGEAKLTEPYMNIYVISCGNCGVGSAIYTNSEQAIEAWNRRVEQNG